MDLLSDYFSWLSWWQMPLSGLGEKFLTFLSAAFVLILIAGLFCFVVRHL